MFRGGGTAEHAVVDPYSPI